MSEEQRKIGERIRELRKRKELSQDDLGALLGCGKVYIHYIETGKRKLKREMAEKLGSFFNLHPTLLLDPDLSVERIYLISQVLSQLDHLPDHRVETIISLLEDLANK